MNIARTIGLLGLCVGLASCASPEAFDTSSAEPTQAVDMAYWTGNRAPTTDGRIAAADLPDSKPPTPHVAARRPPAKLSATGLAHSDSNASIATESSTAAGGKHSAASKSGATGTNWFTPDWYAREQAEADRIKRLINICRC